MSSQRILVTGGAGFIGSALCRMLCANPAISVLNVDKLSYSGTLSSLRELEGRANYRFLKADICDRDALSRAFSEFRPGGVIHLAAETHVDRSIDSATAFVESNVVGVFHLLEAARSYRDRTGGNSFRLLHVSTDEVYGSLGEIGRFSEESAYDPSSPYSASKAAADHLVRAWGRTYGLPVLISNCSNNYGPYHFPEKLIPLIVLNAIEGKALPVYGDGGNVRDWLYVDDHVQALKLILDKGRVGERYNVGGNCERTNIEVVRAICALLDEARPAAAPHARLITFVEDRPAHDQRYAMDASKLERELGWRARESFETGLAKTVRWFLDNEWWWQPLRERAYDGSRLGLARKGS